MPVQVRYETNLTSAAYIIEQGWLHASLGHCPWHPGGGCGFKSHGTYERKDPPGAKVRRWYCRAAQATVSLLPDCLSAKLPGSLADVERVVAEVEAATTVESAADELRPELAMPGRLRWVRRRLGQVYAGLLALRTLRPDRLADCEPRIGAFRDRLGVVPVLPALRELGAQHLSVLPPPIGFGPRRAVRLRVVRREQHSVGPRAPPERP